MKKKIVILASSLVMCLFTACGHEHSFSTATCTSPRTCTECGTTEGQALGHTWKEADCINPKMCTVCNVTEGEALGHTIDVGLCSTCKEIVNESLIVELVECLDKTNDSDDQMIWYVETANTSSYSDMYNNLSKADSELSKSKKYLEEALEICADYDGLRELKKAINFALNSIPAKVKGSDVDSLVYWLNEYTDYLNARATLSQKLADFVKDF